jgi:hypothetical protein
MNAWDRPLGGLASGDWEAVGGSLEVLEVLVARKVFTV